MSRTSATNAKADLTTQDEFTELTDTPSSYSTHGSKFVKVNSGESALEFIAESTIDHGGLAGLSDDDHTQYILVDGTRAFSGNQSFGDFNITNVGDIALDSLSADATRIAVSSPIDFDDTSATAIQGPSNETFTFTSRENSDGSALGFRFNSTTKLSASGDKPFTLSSAGFEVYGTEWTSSTELTHRFTDMGVIGASMVFNPRGRSKPTTVRLSAIATADDSEIIHDSIMKVQTDTGQIVLTADKSGAPRSMKLTAVAGVGNFSPGTDNVITFGAVAARLKEAYFVDAQVDGTLVGGDGASEDLDLDSTSNGTKGIIALNSETNLKGNQLVGNTTSGGDMTLESTSHATKGSIFLGSGATSAYDEVNDRLGLATATPATTLDVAGDITIGEGDTLRLQEANANAGSTIVFDDDATGTQTIFGSYLSSGFSSLDVLDINSNFKINYDLNAAFFGVSVHDFRLGANNSSSSHLTIKELNGNVRFSLDSVGNLRMGSTSPPAADTGRGVIVLANAATAPSTATANASLLYSKDVSSSSELFVRDESNTETQLSPHTFDLYTPDPADKAPWSYYSCNEYTGDVVNADISGALMEIEYLSEQARGAGNGKKFLHYAATAISRVWDDDQNAEKAKKDAERANWGFILDENNQRVQDNGKDAKNPQHYDENGALLPKPPVYRKKVAPKWLKDRFKVV